MWIKKIAQQIQISIRQIRNRHTRIIQKLQKKFGEPNISGSSYGYIRAAPWLKGTHHLYNGEKIQNGPRVLIFGYVIDLWKANNF